jgi:hypothetical protein
MRMWNGFWSRIGNIDTCEQGHKHPGSVRGGRISRLAGQLLVSQNYLLYEFLIEPVSWSILLILIVTWIRGLEVNGTPSERGWLIECESVVQGFRMCRKQLWKFGIHVTWVALLKVSARES